MKRPVMRLRRRMLALVLAPVAVLSLTAASASGDSWRYADYGRDDFPADQSTLCPLPGAQQTEGGWVCSSPLESGP